MLRSLEAMLVLIFCMLFSGINSAWAEDIGCLDTTFKLLSPNDSVCVSAFEDPKVPGVTCHISQARKGGWGSVVGLTEDPSRFSIACRQTGPISLPDKLPDQENVFSEKTSVFFKKTKIVRMFDKKHNTLIYLAVSTKLVEGSPQNSISTVPIMPWGGQVGGLCAVWTKDPQERRALHAAFSGCDPLPFARRSV